MIVEEAVKLLRDRCDPTLRHTAFRHGAAYIAASCTRSALACDPKRFEKEFIARANAIARRDEADLKRFDSEQRLRAFTEIALGQRPQWALLAQGILSPGAYLAYHRPRMCSRGSATTYAARGNATEKGGRTPTQSGLSERERQIRLTDSNSRGNAIANG